MSWEIRIWHEEVGDRTRLTIEADPSIPDDVISSVAGSYWFEEVQFGGAEWEDDDEELDGGPVG